MQGGDLPSLIGKEQHAAASAATTNPLTDRKSGRALGLDVLKRCTGQGRAAQPRAISPGAPFRPFYINELASTSVRTPVLRQ